MATALSQMKILEVSPVDRGANGVPILVRKRDDTPGIGKVQFSKQLETLKALAGDRIDLIANELAVIAQFETLPESDIWEAFWRLHEAAWAAEWDVLPLARAAGAPDALVDKIETNMEAEVAAEEEVEKGEFTEDQTAALAAFEAGEANEEQTAAVMAILSAAAEAGGLYTKPEAVEQQDDEEEVEMQDDEQEIEMAEEEEEDATTVSKAEFAKRGEELVELRKRLEASEHERGVAVHIQKAAKWPNLFAAKDAGPIMKSIHGKLSDDEYTWLEGQLTQSQGFAKMANAFGEVGASGGNNIGDDADSKLTAIAKRYVAEGVCKNEVEGYNKALTENPALYAQYMQDQEA